MLQSVSGRPVSVVMPVHNAGRYLEDAVRSILEQSFGDFEFIILDDGSTDGSLEKLRAWADRDPRIRLLASPHNLGPVGSSNFVARAATSPLVARMDADDISHPQRLEKQLATLQRRPDLDLLGSLCESIDANGDCVRGADVWRVHRRSSHAPFPHGSIMYRRQLFEQLGGYRPDCEFWEDQDFFLRAARTGRVATLVEPLYRYRHSRVSTRLASDAARVEGCVDLMYRAMRELHRSGSYEHLLGQSSGAGERRVDPRVFVSLASLELWGGDRPRQMGRMLSRASIRPNATTLGALLRVAGGTLAPRAYRVAMTRFAAFLNRSARLAGTVPEAVDWRPELPAAAGLGQRGPAGPATLAAAE